MQRLKKVASLRNSYYIEVVFRKGESGGFFITATDLPNLPSGKIFDWAGFEAALQSRYKELNGS